MGKTELEKDMAALRKALATLKRLGVSGKEIAKTVAKASAKAARILFM